MKKLFFALIITASIMACKKDNSTPAPATPVNTPVNDSIHISVTAYLYHPYFQDSVVCQFSCVYVTGYWEILGIVNKNFIEGKHTWNMSIPTSTQSSVIEHWQDTGTFLCQFYNGLDSGISATVNGVKANVIYNDAITWQFHY